MRRSRGSRDDMVIRPKLGEQSVGGVSRGKGIGAPVEKALRQQQAMQAQKAKTGGVARRLAQAVAKLRAGRIAARVAGRFGVGRLGLVGGFLALIGGAFARHRTGKTMQQLTAEFDQFLTEDDDSEAYAALTAADMVKRNDRLMATVDRLGYIPEQLLQITNPTRERAFIMHKVGQELDRAIPTMNSYDLFLEAMLIMPERLQYKNILKDSVNEMRESSR